MSCRILKIALYFSMVESVLGIAVFAIYLLFHFCALQVSCPDSKAEEVAFVFYTTYVRPKDSCNITLGNETVPQYETNPNPLTEPEIIFYWEIILLVIHLALAGTSIILQRLEKESQAGIPWLFVMGLMLVVDLVAFSLTLTDFKYSEMPAEKFSCTLENWSSTRRDLTISSLALVFSRGGLLWLANLFLFISVLRLFLRLARARPGSGDDYWPAYPGPQEEQEVEREERDVLPPVMRTFQPARDSQVHHHHHPPPAAAAPPPSQHQEVRRTPSFVEKIREAEANPGVQRTGSQLWSYTADKTELRNRGQAIKSYRPDQDVDTAFDFLDSYNLREESNRKKSSNLSHILELNSEDIPRARIPAVAQHPEDTSQSRGVGGGTGNRYFVPLKQ